MANKGMRARGKHRMLVHTTRYPVLCSNNSYNSCTVQHTLSLQSEHKLEGM